jgi:hypothetical protein
MHARDLGYEEPLIFAWRREGSSSKCKPEAAARDSEPVLSAVAPAIEVVELINGQCNSAPVQGERR